MPLRLWLRATVDLLTRAGVPSPRVDANLLVAHVLGVEHGRLWMIEELTPAQVAELDELVRRRAEREPLQHLTGTAPFLKLEVRVGPGVFIPRPETELLAKWGVSALEGVTSPVVVDLCSGSGVLALAVASERPDATVYAVELSAQALPWLRRNVEGTSVRVIAGDIREVPIPSAVDLVLCNPPYVPSGQPTPAEVGHDPAEAVFAGVDGLGLIPAVIDRAARLLRGGGQLGLEHDDTHTGLAGLLDAEFADVVTHPDLAGRPRYTTATRRA